MTSSDFVTAFKSVKDAYKPDILTCLANLSNDEVFTPPSLASEMLDLLPQSLFSDPNTKFLDPASKSGVFLREIARRLMKGLEKVIPDEQKRRDHIFTKQIFGIAITELTAQMSRRSLYCSKTANGKYSVCKAFNNADGNLKYTPLLHTFKNGNCIYCGASEKEYGEKVRDKLESHAYKFIHLTEQQIKEMQNMKFDVIIGNPPYQLSDGGAQASATPIYQKFVEQAMKLKPRFLTMIIPSRWFAGGKGLDEFRENMLHDKRIRVLHDFLDASECFPGVEIKGGVCYFLWNRDDVGECQIYTHENKNGVSYSQRYLLDGGGDVFIRYAEALPILEKVKGKKEKSFSEIVSSRRPFGFSTNFDGFSKKGDPSFITIYANKQVGYLTKDYKVEKNRDAVGKWKLFIPKAIGSGNIGDDYIKPIIAKPNSVCTETYIMVGPFDTEKECKNAYDYINTKFFHFLLLLRKVTQDCTQKVYRFIPMQDFSKKWTDKELYKKYNLTKEETDYIERMLNPKVGEKSE